MLSAPRTPKVTTGQLLGVCLLLVLCAFTRLHNLRALPLFVDEGFHIEAAGRVLDGDTIGPGMAYLLHTWYNAYLGPEPPVADWTARAGHVLIGLLGVAALYRLGRSFVSHRAGLIAAALWISSPYLAFFDRMALADPLLSPLSVVAVWAAWRVMRSGAWRWGIVLAGVIALAILAKASGIVWLALPLVAVILAPGLARRARLRLGAIIYGVLLGGFFVPFTLFLRLRGFNYRLYLGESPSHVGGLDANLFERVPRNLADAWSIDVGYLGLPIVLLAIAGGLFWLWRRPRPALLTLLALGIAASGPIVFGIHLNSRYLLSHVPYVLLALACGAGLLIERRAWVGWPVAVALALWALVFYLPFQRDLWTDPADLPLNDDDRIAYLTSESSGYGVRAIGRMLSADAASLPVIGLVANCQPLRIAAYPLDVLCPQIRWDGTSQQESMLLAQQWAAEGPVYVVGENLPYIDLAGLPQPHTLITTVERPGGASRVYLYRIEQGAAVAAGP
jgi:hypothetical protein